MAFYAAGRIAQEHGFAQVYNIDLQHEVEQDTVGFDLAQQQALLYNHLPFLMPILVLLVDAKYAESFVHWAILMLVTYSIACLYFLKTTSGNKDKREYSILLCQNAVLKTLNKPIEFIPLALSLLLVGTKQWLFIPYVFYIILTYCLIKSRRQQLELDQDVKVQI
jgi:hypothetical protein